VEPEPVAMPLHNGCRLDQYHRIDDLRPNPVEPHCAHRLIATSYSD
jgi:hypothetical protein